MPLSAEQLTQLKEWEKHPDPLQRLTTDYYEWCRRLIRQDYLTTLHNANDKDGIDDAKRMFYTNLANLETAYQDDISLSCTLHLMEKNIRVSDTINIQVYIA